MEENQTQIEHQFERTDAEFETRNSINKKRRRGGRPVLLDEERRSCQFKIGYTPSQYRTLCARADKIGLTEIELIRRLSLNQEIHAIPTLNKEAIIQLLRIGNNLNQLTKLAHQNNLEGLTESIKRFSEEVAQLTRNLLTSKAS